MENQRNIQEDEIDIGEYINVIIKRKKLIFSVFFALVAISAVSNLKIPKVYEITSTIQLGSVNELLIRNEDAKAIIFNQNSLLSIIKDLGLNLDVKSLQSGITINDIPGTNLLRLKITNPSIDTAFKINNAIVNPLISQGQKMYQERLAIINERVKELDSEIMSSESDIVRTQSIISGLPNSNNISQSDVSLRIILLQNTLPNYESNLSLLRNQRNELKLILSNAKEFRIFDSPIKPEHPIGSNLKQNMLISGVFGLIIGVFLAVFLEFLQNSKSYYKKDLRKK